MIRQWYLILITLLISVMIMKSINANSDEDDDEDDDDEDKKFDYDDEDDYSNYKNYKKYQHDKHDHDDEGNCMTTTSDVCEPTLGAGSKLGITPTDGQTGPRVCNGTIIDEAFYRFNAIFFGDFYTYGGQDILGPLAVKGDFHAPNYVVNANKGQDCSATNSLESYGLVVGGSVKNTPYTQVHGSAYIAGGQGLDSLLELESGCEITGSKGTGLIDFVDLEEKAKDYSFQLAAQSPTLQLGPGGVVTRLGRTRGGMEFVTFNSCNPSSVCENIWPDAMSNAEEVLFGQGNWNGVQGNQPDPFITYVFNIPVVETTTIDIRTNQPTVGFNGCRVLLNFYPVKATGGYGQYSAFTILRNTGSALKGFVLAPYGNIRDGSAGNFAGTIVARSYTWAYTVGVEIHDYRSEGGDCDYFQGCVPDDPDNIECTSVSIAHHTTTLDHTTIEDHTTTVGTTTIAMFTTTVGNIVTSTEKYTTTTTEKDTTTTTEELTITSPVTTTTTTLQTTTVTSNILTVSETTTTTKLIVGTIVTRSDTTYTEVNTQTVTLLLPTTITDTTIATETQVNLIYDTTTFTDCTTANTESNNGISRSTDSTYTHTHDENCGHDYHNYKKHQENKHYDEDE